jgi:hypothetical protein
MERKKTRSRAGDMVDHKYFNLIFFR